MSSLDRLMERLDERSIAREISVWHDDALNSYRLGSNTVRDWSEFMDVITDYASYHFSFACCRKGRGPSRSADCSMAYGDAREFLQEAYGHDRGHVEACRNAIGGVKGGMRAVLAKIAEGYKARCIRIHVRAAFEEIVDPTSWHDKVELISQFGSSPD